MLLKTDIGIIIGGIEIIIDIGIVGIDYYCVVSGGQ